MHVEFVCVFIVCEKIRGLQMFYFAKAVLQSRRVRQVMLLRFAIFLLYFLIGSGYSILRGIAFLFLFQVADLLFNNQFFLLKVIELELA